MNTKAGKKAKNAACTCKVPGCKKTARARLVCGTHHSGFYRAVQAGEITWAELEAAGLVGPGKPKSGCRELVASVKAAKAVKQSKR